MKHATYNITDNRLKYYPEPNERLTPDQNEARRKMGFAWFPGQKCWSKTWTPSAEDWIKSEFGVEILEDDSADDVEARVERYTGYGANAEQEAAAAAERALNATTARRARLSGSRAESEAERAAYWTARIAGAISRAEQHDSPVTCANRVKALQADLRKQEREYKEDSAFLAAWKAEGLTDKRALYIANYDPCSHGLSLWRSLDAGTMTASEAAAIAIPRHESNLAHIQRWIDHLKMRLEYESAYALACGADLSLAVRKAPVKRTAPDDGLKKGVAVLFRADYWGRGKEHRGVVMSLGADNVRIMPDSGDPEYSAPYYQKNGVKTRREYVRIEK